jgi:hypothetical protein
MRMRGGEFSLADLFETPALSLAIAYCGFDRRSLEQVLEVESCTERRRPHPAVADQSGAFIAE